MERMLAYCGLTCTDCPAYIATQNDDDQERAKVAEMWSKEFGVSLQAEDVICDGCLSENGRRFKHCDVCKIRSCAISRQIANCAYCDEYVCNELNGILQYVPAAKENLDQIRSAR